MLLVILGVIDVLVGITLIFPNFLVTWLAWIVLIKGIFSVGGSAAAGYFFDFMGWIDLVAAVLLFFNLSVPWFWLLPLVKGVYSIFMGMISG